MMTEFNFEILSNKPISTYLKSKNIHDFKSTVTFLKSTPSELNLTQDFVVKDLEETMSTSSKIHAVLADLAVENDINEVELMMGIFLVDQTTFPELENYFADKPYSSIALTTSYLKVNDKRIDFSTEKPIIERISSKIIREQRMDPHQSKEWKEKIYEDYIQKWLKRNPYISHPINEILREEKRLIELISS